MASPGSLAIELGPLRGDELPAAVDVVARAFRDNPLNRAVMPKLGPEERVRSNAAGMRAFLPVAWRRGEVLAARLGGAASRLAGVLIAVPAGRFPLPPPAFGQRLRVLWRQGPAVAVRWGTVYTTLLRLHPPESHSYLATLGVAPEVQARGVGRRLLAAWLDGRERDGAPFYLETDRDENVAFYERAGFEVVGEVDLFGARVRTMLRPPASGT
jgi:ribosomal protein S18 acetylase RimI-like enzyme